MVKVISSPPWFLCFSLIKSLCFISSKPYMSLKYLGIILPFSCHSEKIDWYNLSRFFIQAYILWKRFKKNPHIIESSSCIPNILCVIDLILLNTFCGVYSVLKESKYTVIFLSINNETQCMHLLFCHRDSWHTLHLLFSKKQR